MQDTIFDTLTETINSIALSNVPFTETPNFFDLYHQGGINSITQPRYTTSLIMRRSMKVCSIGFR